MRLKILAVASDTGSVQAVTPVLANAIRSNYRSILIAPKKRQIPTLSPICNRELSIIHFDGIDDQEAVLRRAVETLSPRVILTGSSVPRHPDLPTAEQTAIRLGRQFKIPVVTVFDAWGYYPERLGLRQGMQLYVPDVICALDETCRQELLTLGVSGEKVLVTNNPWMDRFCNDTNGIEKLDTEEKTIIFVSQPLAEVTWPRKWEYDQRDLFELLMKGVAETKLKLKVRVWVHPSESVFRWEDLIAEYSGVVEIQTDRSPAALAHADLLVTGHSTIIYQALHLGVPCVVLRPAYSRYDDHLPDRLGLTIKVTDPLEVGRTLLRAMTDGVFELKKRTRELKVKNVFFSSGNATDLVLNALKNYF